MTTEDLFKKIEGNPNIRFIIPMKKTGVLSPLGLMVSSSDPDIDTVCKITEDRYKLKDNYKISLIPEKGIGYREDYYITDFTSLINQGYIKIKE